MRIHSTTLQWTVSQLKEWPRREGGNNCPWLAKWYACWGWCSQSPHRSWEPYPSPWPALDPPPPRAGEFPAWTWAGKSPACDAETGRCRATAVPPGFLIRPAVRGPWAVRLRTGWWSPRSRRGIFPPGGGRRPAGPALRERWAARRFRWDSNRCRRQGQLLSRRRGWAHKQEKQCCGTGSISQRYGSGSLSLKQNSKKNIDTYGFMTSLWLFIFWRSLMKIEGSVSGSAPKFQGSATL